jgi:hypothetical protein
MFISHRRHAASWKLVAPVQLTLLSYTSVGSTSLYKVRNKQWANKYSYVRQLKTNCAVKFKKRSTTPKTSSTISLHPHQVDIGNT